MSKPYLDLNEIFTYHRPFGNQAERYEKLRAAAKAYAEVIIELTPPSAEQTLAIRDVQRASMMANAAIAINEKESAIDPPHETIEAIFQRQTIDRGFQGQEVRIFLVPSPHKDVLMKAGAIVNNPDSIAQYNPVWTDIGDGLHRSQRYRVKIQDSFKNLGSCVVLEAEAIDEKC